MSKGNTEELSALGSIYLSMAIGIIYHKSAVYETLALFDN